MAQSIPNADGLVFVSESLLAEPSTSRSQSHSLEPEAARSTRQANRDAQRALRDPHYQTSLDSTGAEYGVALYPPSPSSAPALTLSYRSLPHPSSHPTFSSLPRPPPRTARPPPSPASVRSQTSISAASSVTSPTASNSTAQAAPKANAWGAPKSWAHTVSRNGPIGISVNFSEPSSAAHSPVHGNRSRKSTQGKSSVVSLERLLSDSHTEFQAPLIHPRGLVNKGNFCFANAILQTLVYCAPFYNLFALVAKQVSADFGNATPLMEAVIQFIQEFYLQESNTEGFSPSHSEPLLPEYVYDAMRLNKRFDQMRRGHQEDAEEFLGFFLDTLHEELLAAQRKSALKLAQSGSGSLVSKMSEQEKKLNGVSDDDLRRLGVKIPLTGPLLDAQLAAAAAAEDSDQEIVQRELMRPVSPSEEGWMEVGQKGKTAYTRTTSTSESPITRLFGGKLRSVLKTPGAKDSVTLEPYQPLQLDIQPAHVQSIQDALLNLTLPETIPGVWSPARACQVDATKQVFIESLPPILVLHLKRFIYDEIGGVQKSQKPLAYGTVLEIAPEVLSPAMRTQGKQRYRLFGVVYHHGRSATGGHYTVDVLRQDGLSWLHIDDTMFQTIPTEQVVRNAHSLTTKDHGHDGLAYLLFYRRELESDLQNSSVPSPVAHSRPTPSAPTPLAATKALSAVTTSSSAATKPRKTPNGTPAASSPSSPRVPQDSSATFGPPAPLQKRAIPGWDR